MPLLLDVVLVLVTLGERYNNNSEVRERATNW